MSLTKLRILPSLYLDRVTDLVVVQGLNFVKHRYNTRSNKVRVIKTPGGKLRYLHIKKKGSPPKCGDCGIKLPGVSLYTAPFVIKHARGSQETLEVGEVTEFWPRKIEAPSANSSWAFRLR